MEGIFSGSGGAGKLLSEATFSAPIGGVIFALELMLPQSLGQSHGVLGVSSQFYVATWGENRWGQ